MPYLYLKNNLLHTHIFLFFQLALAQKINVLAVIERICNETLQSILKNVAVDVIELAVEEMVNTKVIKVFTFI